MPDTLRTTGCPRARRRAGAGTRHRADGYALLIAVFAKTTPARGRARRGDTAARPKSIGTSLGRGFITLVDAEDPDRIGRIVKGSHKARMLQCFSYEDDVHVPRMALAERKPD